MAKLALTINEVLNNLSRAQHFYRYAKAIHCAENLDFLYACRQLNPALGTVVFRPLPATVVAQGPAAAAGYIYDRFVLATGNHPGRVQVNIDSGIKTALDQQVQQGTLGTTSFNRAYADVLALVTNDTWKRFANPSNDQAILSKTFWDNNDLRGYIRY